MDDYFNINWQMQSEEFPDLGEMRLKILFAVPEEVSENDGEHSDAQRLEIEVLLGV